MLQGCSGGGAPPPMNQLHIETAAGWYQLYRADHNGKAPPNEQEFTSFIQRKLQESGRSADMQELLTSPRDGKKYVINYKPNSNNMERNVAVYESEGYGGTKWMAFENKWSEEVDEAKLQEYLARK
jgi:hypothetical protein